MKNCEQVKNYEDTEEYANKCKQTIKHLREYVEEKIEMDNNDKLMMTNPNSYIEKCGALNALYDIKKILDRFLER